VRLAVEVRSYQGIALQLAEKLRFWVAQRFSAAVGALF